jgi:uncharacterized protein (DUF433 family)
VLSDHLEEAREWLREREGWPSPECIKEMKLGGMEHVLYCDLESTIGDTNLNAESLAKFAVESVRLKPKRNGIAYLARNIEQGIVTPLTYAYRDAILQFTGSGDLEEAEKKVLAEVKKQEIDGMTITDRIEINPKVMMGKPVIRGTRIPIELILRKLSEGATEEDLLDAYPRFKVEDIQAAIGYAADTLAHEETIILAPAKKRAKQ